MFPKYMRNVSPRGLLLVLFVDAIVLTIGGIPLQAQLCTGTNPNPPCVLTSAYAGPASDANLNNRQAINPYERTLTPGTVSSLSATGMLFEVDDRKSQLRLFSLTTSGVFHKIALTSSFTGLCPCGLIQGHDGRIYGAAAGGGAYGYGVIFAIHVGLTAPKPEARQFTPPSGPVGTRVRIWGYNLLLASVRFNGVPATKVQNAGPNYVWTTVPTAATTGPITVTTPGGTATTQASFTANLRIPTSAPLLTADSAYPIPARSAFPKCVPHPPVWGTPVFAIAQLSGRLFLHPAQTELGLRRG